MRRALVTGGFGYIGGHLVRHLLGSGWEVAILDSMFAARSWEFGSAVGMFSDSVCNPETVGRAMRGANIVYHLAVRMDRSSSPKHAVRLFHTNVIGTATVLSVAHEIGVDNIVFASSAAVYGNVVGAEEYGPTYPVDLYGCSKLAAEVACRHYFNLGMNVKVLRLFNVWGGRYDKSVVSKFVHGDNEIYNDGNQTRDFVYIGDVIRALLDAQGWDPFVYNIGTGVETTINGLWAILRGNEVPTYRELRYNEIYRSCAETSYVSEHTGWKPTTLLSELNAEEIRQLCL